jgi:hypothetical protein
MTADLGGALLRRREAKEAVTKKKKRLSPLQCKPREPPTAAAANHRNPKRGMMHTHMPGGHTWYGCMYAQHTAKPMEYTNAPLLGVPAK